VSKHLISSLDLRERLSDPNTFVFDTRFSLGEKDFGRNSYTRGHIPGAFFLDLEEDLSGERTRSTGRHPLPNVAALSEKLRSAGLSNSMHVVVYDESSNCFAARLWWLLKWMGHDDVALLDGGFRGWIASRGKSETNIPVPRQNGQFQPRLRAEMVVTAAEILASRQPMDLLIVDARSPERFVGSNEPIDRVAGHVPGAINMPFKENLTVDDHFLDIESLRLRHGVYARARASAQIVHMCGSGVTACHNVFSTVLAGFDLPKLYPGSWSEWITDVSRPISLCP